MQLPLAIHDSRNRCSASARGIGQHGLTAIVEHQLCSGCGACAYACSKSAVQLKNFPAIGIRPVVDADKCEGCRECLEVCPGHVLEHNREDWSRESLPELTTEWGPVLEVWEGHAADSEIRHRGGSGGATTALALYCLEQENMQGALHVGIDFERPYLNQTIVSTTRAELLSRAGARYAPAAVCAELGQIEQAQRPLVMIGKPCDVAAAQMARRRRPRLDQNLGLTISIFCAGTPSTEGTFELLRQLGVAEQEIDDLRYRGHGWPGMTGVHLRTAAAGRVEMTYQRAWDTILTKYKPFRCHICPDGTGEFADIACGDPWYRRIEPGEPGSTLILVRTERGRRIMRAAMQHGYLEAIPRAADVLPDSQPALRMRRSHIWPKFLWRFLLRLPTPSFRGFSLGACWLRTPARRIPVAMFRAAKWMAGIWRRGRRRLTPSEIEAAEPIQDGRQVNNPSPKSATCERFTQDTSWTAPSLER